MLEEILKVCSMKAPEPKQSDGLSFLGKQVSEPTQRLDLIPWDAGELTVKLECTEFTSFCPVTKMPDFGQLVIEYVPDKHIAETKSVKLYLQGYRDCALFNEKLVAKIADEWFAQLKPLRLRVTGLFNHRGGIAVTAIADRLQEVKQP